MISINFHSNFVCSQYRILSKELKKGRKKYFSVQQVFENAYLR